MCGIGGFALTDKGRRGFPVDAFAKKVLLGIESRGTHATGYLTVAPGKKPRIKMEKEADKATDFIKTHTLDNRSQITLLHTRAWTQGNPSINDNNHPVMWNNCYAIHNGSIRNDDAVLVEAGVGKTERVGTVDSFAVSVALDYHGWGADDDIKSSLHMLRGPFAIAACDPVTKPGRVLLAKGEISPLEVLIHPNGIFWASEKEAITNAWGDTLGTPPDPKQRTMNPNHMGWFTFMEGDFWVIDVSTGKLEINAGRFDVNKTYMNNNHAANGYTGTAWKPYTYDDRAWTCWPNEKNCVFQDDCKNCNTNDCDCFEGNHFHPVLNSDVTYDGLGSKHTTFRSHVAKYHLAKDKIERPTNGVRVIKPSPQASTTSGSPTTESPTPSKNTSQLALVKASGVLDTSSCFYCEEVYRTRDMDELKTVIISGEKIYACKACNSQSQSTKAHSPAMRPAILKVMKQAVVAEEIITAAVQATAWEFKVPARFIKFVSLYNPKGWDGKDDPDFAKFVNTVKVGFLENVKVVTELRDLEKVSD